MPLAGREAKTLTLAKAISIFRQIRGSPMVVAPESSAAQAAAAFSRASGFLLLADGTVFEGHGFGAIGHAAGEVCFNTAMTGYEEILTDPSYAAQIVAFTFPHIGIVGTNSEDIESLTPAVRAVVVRAD